MGVYHGWMCVLLVVFIAGMSYLGLVLDGCISRVGGRWVRDVLLQ